VTDGVDDLARRFAAWRADPGLVLLEGFHALKHALRFGARIEAALARDPAALDALAAALAPDVRAPIAALARPVDDATLRRLTPQPHHTGVVALARRPARALADAPADAPVVLLEAPRRLGNVGAVVRVAAAADAAAVATTGPLDPWDPAALRGSAGLHFALPVARVADASADGLAGRPLVALDPAGDVLDPARLPAGAVLAFGTERHGLSDELLARADARLRLPMRAGVSSLNLATAVAAVLFAGRLGR
jgi:TrmH family RNA methyltransferase